MLLKHGADPNIQASDERTPIFYAVKHPKIVKLLVDITDLTIKDEDDMNVMQYCYRFIQNPNIYEIYKGKIVKSIAILSEKMS